MASSSSSSFHSLLFLFACSPSIFLLLSGAGLHCAGGSGLTLTLINNCGPNTLYPGVQVIAGSEHLYDGGFPMGPGNVTSIGIPVGWSGLIWPRTDCDFSKRPSCSVGDCGPRVQFMGAPPRKPVTVVRLSVDADAAAVAYEVDICNAPKAIPPK